MSVKRRIIKVLAREIKNNKALSDAVEKEILGEGEYHCSERFHASCSRLDGMLQIVRAIGFNENEIEREATELARKAE